MMQNKELFNHLNDQLDKLIKNKLKQPGKMVCEKEVLLIRECLNQAALTPTTSAQEGTIIDVASTLNHLLAKIDAQISALEKECGGVVNYPLYMNEKIKHLEFKLQLRKTIKHMLRHIYQEFPEIKTAVE